ncbi:MAG: hypothetical protein WC869_00280 [Phycisphaerae bacterium]|jgi:hypothetical protein
MSLPPPPAAPPAAPPELSPAEILAKAYADAVAGLPPDEAKSRLDHIRLIANMSPSAIGDYAACPLKAVYDADYPRVFKPQFQCYSNFGKICHWQTQYMIGGATLEDRPPQKEWDSARDTPDVPSTPANFLARVEQCATVAAAVVRDATPLPPGVQWKSEIKAYSKNWLRYRIGRKGDNCGFGGSIDLAASDRSVLWDLKFVGAKKVPQESDINPKFRPDAGFLTTGNAGVKNVYVWQCGSYHILTQIPRTNIVWVGRDGKTKSYVGMDWSSERGQVFANSIKSFLTFVDTPGFRQLAWPIRATHCDDCSHKDRCPAWMISSAKSPDYKRATANFDVLESLIKDNAGAAVTVPFPSVDKQLPGVPLPAWPATLPPPPAPPAGLPPPPPPPSGISFQL